MSEQLIVEIIGTIGAIIGSLAGVFIWAFVIQLATKVVAKFKPPYWMVCKAVLTGSLLRIAIVFVVTGFFVDITLLVGEFRGVFLLVARITNFLVFAGIYSVLIKSPQNEPLGLRKASMVSLI